ARAVLGRDARRGGAAGAAIAAGRAAVRFGLLRFGALTTTGGSALAVGAAGVGAAAWALASSVTVPISNSALIGSEAASRRPRRIAGCRELRSSAERGCVVILIFLQDAAQKRDCEECGKPPDF
ncbi:MAG: hypothetical protein QM576_03035, partial [Rhodopseudomonas sp.]|uniref:hypothetical protein n=1 Tax=Rhodopseudomonas sp. TaxID=1078 RepID=UPI0039E4615E